MEIFNNRCLTSIIQIPLLYMFKLKCENVILKRKSFFKGKIFLYSNCYYYYTASVTEMHSKCMYVSLIIIICSLPLIVVVVIMPPPLLPTHATTTARRRGMRLCLHRVIGARPCGTQASATTARHQQTVCFSWIQIRLRDETRDKTTTLTFVCICLYVCIYGNKRTGAGDIK